MIKKSLYDIAIDGIGYLLSGTPQDPQRSMSEAPTYGAIPTEIEYEYSDASHLFAWTQTDWSLGYQDEIWKNNGKYRYGENIDPLKEYGKLRLLPELTDILSLDAGQTYKSSVVWNQDLYVGTSHATLAKLYSINEADTTADVTTGWTAITDINSMTECLDKLVLGLSRSTGAEHTIQTYDGSAFADVETTYETVRTVFSVGDRCYAGVYVDTATGDRLIYTDDIDGATPTWETRLAKFGKNKQIIKGVDYFGLAYFLVQDYPALELWYEDGTDIERIYRWDNLINPDMKLHNQTIMITGQSDGNTYAYGWNGAQIIPLYEEKEAIAQSVDSRYLVEWKSDLYFQGVRFDTQYFFTGFKYKYGANNKRPFAAYGHGASNMYFFGVDGSTTKIQRTDEAAFPTTGFEESGLFRDKPAIDKLWYSADVSFEALKTGESVNVQYSIDNGANWVSLGTASTVGDTSATFYFAENTKSRFIQRRTVLGSGGTTTPIVNDVTFRYKILPHEKQVWSLSLRCSDKLQLKDGKSPEPKYGEELRNLLRIARWKNRVVDFEDYDYFETALNADLAIDAVTATVDSTQNAPEQGRIRVNSEEIFYTGKTRTTFTGLTRGARNTVASAHSDNDTVSTIYKVLITDYKEILPVSNKPNEREYIAQISLLEI